MPTIPASVDSERAIIATCLAPRSPLVAHIFQRIRADHFSDAHCAATFKALYALYGQSRPLTPIVVAEYLRESGDAVSWRAVTSPPAIPARDSAELAEYICLIEQKYTLRVALDAAVRFEESVMTGKGSVEALAKLQHRLADLSVRSRPTTFTLDEFANEWVDGLVSRADGNKVFTPTGFTDLDITLGGGLEPQRLYVIGARPGTGKSTIAVNIALQTKVPVLLFSLEMPKHEVFQRIVASVAKIPAKSLTDPALLTQLELDRLKLELPKIRKLPLTINESHGIAELSLLAEARAWRQKIVGPCLIVVDYLHLVKPANKHSDRNDLELADTVYALKGLAKELDCPVLCLSQLKRESTYKSKDGSVQPPALTDLKGSSGIDDSADCVLLLWEKLASKLTDKVINVQCVKNRVGPRRDFLLRFYGQYFKFGDYAAQPKPE